MTDERNRPSDGGVERSVGIETDIRMRNEVKKLELSARCGLDIHECPDELPLELEEEWLRNIERFEEQFALGLRTTVRTRLDNPVFPVWEQIPADQRSFEIGRVLELYQSHGIGVDFLSDPPDERMYAFLTVELIEREIDDIVIEGFTWKFEHEQRDAVLADIDV